MTDYCLICKKKVLSHAHSLTCAVCLNTCHLKCIPGVSKHDELYTSRSVNDWLCSLCLSDNLPFTNIPDDNEFINALSDFWLNPTNITLADVDDVIFNLFDLDDNEIDGMLSENDPDLIFFNNIRVNSLSSNYLVEDKFNVKCSQLSLNNDCFSIIHLNIRSIPKNLRII